MKLIINYRNYRLILGSIITLFIYILISPFLQDHYRNWTNRRGAVFAQQLNPPNLAMTLNLHTIILEIGLYSFGKKKIKFDIVMNFGI